MCFLIIFITIALVYCYWYRYTRPFSQYRHVDFEDIFCKYKTKFNNTILAKEELFKYNCKNLILQRRCTYTI